MKIKNLFGTLFILLSSIGIDHYLVSIRTDDFDYTKWGVVLVCFALVTTIIYLVDVIVLKEIDLIGELREKNVAVAIVIASIFITAAIILAGN